MPEEDELLTQEKVNLFEDILSDINASQGSWTDRRDKLKALLSEDALSDLEEIAGWFADEG